MMLKQGQHFSLQNVRFTVVYIPVWKLLQHVRKNACNYYNPQTFHTVFIIFLLKLAH